jgi:hypothetical protein
MSQDFEIAPFIDQTVSTLRDDPRAITSGGFIALIDQWLNAHAQAGRDDLNQLSSVMGEIRAALVSTPQDESVLADLLRRAAGAARDTRTTLGEDGEEGLDRLADQLERSARAFTQTTEGGQAASDASGSNVVQTSPASKGISNPPGPKPTHLGKDVRQHGSSGTPGRQFNPD